MARRRAKTALLVIAATLLAPAGIAQASPVPLSETSSRPTDLQVERALDALERGSARPVKLNAPRPGWFTPRVERRLRERRVVAAPVDAPLPGEVGIRPGSWMVSPFHCTMNYIFEKRGRLAIGTAGHCLEGGEPVVLLTVAPTGGNPVLVRLGRVLLRRDGGIGNDYGLVEVPQSRREWVFPTIAGVGGPCGVYDRGDPRPVAHYGHGLLLGTGGTPRAGMGLEVPGSGRLQLEWDQNSYAWAGTLSPGDSGSPVRIGQMPAVGNLTHGVGLTDLPTPSPIGWGTRVTTLVDRGWRLVNSPLCP